MIFNNRKDVFVGGNLASHYLSNLSHKEIMKEALDTLELVNSALNPGEVESWADALWQYGKGMSLIREPKKIR